MAQIELIITDQSGTRRIFAEQLGADPNDPIVHYHKLGYGAVETFNVLEEKPATDDSVAAIGTAVGAKADAAATTDTGTFSLIAFVKRLLGMLGDGSLKAIARGAAKGATAAADATVTAVDADHNAVDAFVRNATLPLPTGAATAAGAANIATGQDSVDDSSGQLVAARATRRTVTIQNNSTTVVYLGASGVSDSNGFPLAGIVGAAVPLAVRGAIHAVTATGETADVSWYEEYD